MSNDYVHYVLFTNLDRPVKFARTPIILPRVRNILRLRTLLLTYSRTLYIYTHVPTRKASMLKNRRLFLRPINRKTIVVRVRTKAHNCYNRAQQPFTCTIIDNPGLLLRSTKKESYVRKMYLYRIFANQ